MSDIFTHHKWKKFAITVLCSNENCEQTITIDSRQVDGFIYCSRACVKVLLNENL